MLIGIVNVLSDELPVLWFVNVLTNECLHFGGANNSCESAIKDELGDPGCRLDLDFENVRLGREQHAQLQLLGYWFSLSRTLFSSYVGLDHFCRIDDAVELFFRHEAQL